MLIILDFISGKGRYTYKDGRTYEGHFFEDKLHGFGKFTWPESFYNSIKDTSPQILPFDVKQTSD